jgi:hypothetical protein
MAAGRPQWRDADLCLPEVCRGGLAASSIHFGVEAHFLTFAERTHTGALDRADVNEHVLIAAIRSNESEAFVDVEELHCSDRH